MSRIIDAVSIVMTCGDEIFAIQRQNFLNAFPGYWAFPGGKVEIGDEQNVPPHDLTKELDSRLFGAVIREGKEELGIDIGEEIAKGTVRAVNYLGLAVTPDFNPYRFATYFFKIDFHKKLDFVVDTNEAQVHEWMSCEKLLKLFEEGAVLAVPPVINVIQTLGRNPDTTFIKNIAFDYDSTKYVPFIESLRGIRQFMPLSHTLPPAVRTNAFLIGDEKVNRILIDPSPKNTDEYNKLLATIAPFGVDKILITHHHPDHYERSNLLARELKVPVLLSLDTLNRINKIQPGFFDGIEIELVKEGDVVTKWLGHDVIVMEIPGHDEGQIALYPKNKAWFLAGDLFQGIGTVVIGGEEGNMKKYFDTLERIIKLDPKVVFPSHGIGLGGTNILQKTLAHRKMREKQILDLHKEGHSEHEILTKIYADVDKALWPYALENIHKHMDKLRAENLI